MSTTNGKGKKSPLHWAEGELMRSQPAPQRQSITCVPKVHNKYRGRFCVRHPPPTEKTAPLIYVIFTMGSSGRHHVCRFCRKGVCNRTPLGVFASHNGPTEREGLCVRKNRGEPSDQSERSSMIRFSLEATVQQAQAN